MLCEYASISDKLSTSPNSGSSEVFDRLRPRIRVKQYSLRTKTP